MPKKNPKHRTRKGNVNRKKTKIQKKNTRINNRQGSTKKKPLTFLHDQDVIDIDEEDISIIHPYIDRNTIIDLDIDEDFDYDDDFYDLELDLDYNDKKNIQPPKLHEIFQAFLRQQEKQIKTAKTKKKYNDSIKRIEDIINSMDSQNNDNVNHFGYNVLYYIIDKILEPDIIFQIMDNYEDILDHTTVLKKFIKWATDISYFTNEQNTILLEKISFLRSLTLNEKNPPKRRYSRSVFDHNSTAFDDEELRFLIDVLERDFMEEKQEEVEIENSYDYSSALYDIKNLLPSELKIWKRLIKLSIQFRDLEPWVFFKDNQVFAIENPVTHKPCYCSIMGFLGQHFALAIYESEPGLNSFCYCSDPDSYYKTLPHQESLFNFLMHTEGFQINFENMEYITEVDRYLYDITGMTSEIIPKKNIRKNIHSSFLTNSNIYDEECFFPIFRKYTPFYSQWFISVEEAKQLIPIVEQAIEIINKVFSNEIIIPRFFGQPTTIPIQKQILELNDKDKKPKWVTKTLNISYNPNNLIMEDFLKRQIDTPPSQMLNQLSKKIAKIKKMAANKKRRTSRIWEVEFIFFCEFLQDSSERPWVPMNIMCLEKNSNKIIFPLDFKIYPVKEVLKNYYDTFLQGIYSEGIIPKEIHCLNSLTLELLQPLMEKLNIKIKKVSQLTSFQHLKEFLSNNFGLFSILPIDIPDF